MKTIRLKRGKHESLARRHPWLFSGAIESVPDGIQEGELVRVVSHEGEPLATGHYGRGSIAVRVLTWGDEPIDEAFWHSRLASALGVRSSLGIAGRADSDIFRLVHGEGDGLPGLVVDVYGATAVVQAHSVGMHECRHEIASALQSVMGGRLQSIYYKSEATLRYEADTQGWLMQGPHATTATENALRFHIDWQRGQKTGFFIDQRENRALVERYAQGRRVLNMFCYTGGFSVYALRGGAALVHSVDSSQKAIDLVNANVELNFPACDRHEAFAADAFRFLDDCTESYDLVILDPPAFAKHQSALRQALRGYTKLNARAMAQMPVGSVLFTFSCSQAVSKEQFRLAVFTAAAIAGRKVRILHQLHQPADHPVSIYHPEGEYLKGLVLYIE